MEPFELRTPRLILDQPRAADVDDIAAYCVDPAFERFMVTPWPYERVHAIGFVEEYVPQGWATDSEWTWAIRERSGSDPDAPLLGVVGVRLGSGMVGYWLGAPHRGRGLLPESLTAAIEEVWARTDLGEILWECTVGNAASLRVAQKCGFRFTGEGTGLIRGRDDGPITAWTGALSRADDRSEKSGWPAIAG